MALFTRKAPTTPDAGLEAERNALSARKSGLGHDLAAAQSATQQASADLTEATIAGDKDSESNVQRRLDAARGQVAARAAAVDEIEQRIAAVKQRIAERDDKLARAASAAEATTLATALDDAFAAHTRAAADLHDALTKVRHLSASAGEVMAGLGDFAHFGRAATLRAISDVAGYASAVAEGRTPIRAAPSSVVAPVAPPKPKADVQRRSVYLFQDSTWTDIDGPRSAWKWSIVELPLDIADRAVCANMADRPDTKRARDLMASYGRRHIAGAPDPAQCAGLDKIPSSAAAVA
jgi:hypothetical protein